MNANILPTEIHRPHNSNSESGSDLRKLGDSRISTDRPIPARQSPRISFTGGETLKIRLPDLGETGLSDAEIDHAMTYGISA